MVCEIFLVGRGFRRWPASRLECLTYGAPNRTARGESAHFQRLCSARRPKWRWFSELRCPSEEMACRLLTGDTHSQQINKTSERPLYVFSQPSKRSRILANTRRDCCAGGGHSRFVERSSTSCPRRFVPIQYRGDYGRDARQPRWPPRRPRDSRLRNDTLRLARESSMN